MQPATDGAETTHINPNIRLKYDNEMKLQVYMYITRQRNRHATYSWPNPKWHTWTLTKKKAAQRNKTIHK